MKIIVIGDIHGHSSWKKIIDQEKDFDLIIFLGDYFDSFGVGVENIHKNYKEIREFQEQNEDKVITLMGNHDLHYLIPTEYSGYKWQTKSKMYYLLLSDYENNLLPRIHIVDNIIFSHAGITKTWLNNINGIVSLDTIEEKLIAINSIPLFHFDINYIDFNMYGDSISNGPLWVRPASLLKDKLDNFIQIVGHTHFKNHKINTIDDVYFCDSLPNEYLIINNNNFIIKQL